MPMPDTEARRRGWALANACCLTFMATIDGSIVNIALPEIARSFGAGIGSVQWVVTSYLIAISSTLLVWGRLADIYGRRRFFAAGLAIFTLGSLACALAGSLAALVAARVLQALGAAMGMALVQGIVTSIFPPADRGKALGIVGAVVSIGSLLGPSLGGILVRAAGWRSIFLVNLPVGAAAVALTFAVMPESKGTDEKRFDLRGAFLLALAVSGLFAALLMAQAGHLPAPALAAALAAVAAAALAFVRVERRHPAPLLDGSLFANRVFSSGLVASLLSYMAMFGYIFIMPFYLQSVRGLDILRSGLLMSLYPLVTGLLAPLAGSLSDRITYKPLTIFGLALTALVLASMTSFGRDTPLPLIGLCVSLLGVGGAAFTSPNTSSVMGSAPRDRLGLAGSISAFFRNLGMVAGTSAAVFVFSIATNSGSGGASGGAMDAELFLRGLRLVLAAGAAMALAGSAVNAGRVRRDPGAAGRPPR